MLLFGIQDPEPKGCDCLNEIQKQLDRIRHRQPLRDIVYQYLKENILAGSYSQGQRLMEAEIAAELNISRTPVREAFRKLEQDGIVSYEAGHGIVVTYLASKDMFEIYAIMVALEGMAARLAAEHMSDKEIVEMEALLTLMDAALEQEDYKEFQRLHMVFNDTLFNVARNRHLNELLKQYWEYIVRTQNASWSYKKDELKGGHWQVLRAIRARDADSAERAMRNHVEACRQAYLECTEAE